MFLAKIWSYDPRCKGPVLTLLPSWKTERDGDEPSASCKYPKVTWSSKAFVQRLIEIIWQKVQRKVSESIFSFILLQTIHSLSILACFIGGKKHSLWVLFCADDSQDVYILMRFSYPRMENFDTCYTFAYHVVLEEGTEPTLPSPQA